MRLLDHVAQCTAPIVVRQTCGDVWRLTGPSDYAQAVTRCPLRYVLADELVHACIELAYSEGAGLSSCLDLVHLPAESMWIEWDSAAQRQAVAQMLPECATGQSGDSLRHGVLISADSAGRRGSLRTFWLTPTVPPEPMMAAVETTIDLNGGLQVSPAEALLDGGSVAVHASRSPRIDDLLHCASFRLNEAWHRYYAAVARTAPEREEVLRRSLATVAFDAPMLIALFLLMGLRSELVQIPLSRERLNAKRLRLGKPPLLAHIEVSCPVLMTERRRESNAPPTAIRAAPRLHHVRGHIVRREDSVFWRRSHWRGHLRLGAVQSRTVTLRLPAAAGQSQSAG
ncbi:MAG TPA: hypothetical protein VLX90_07125 [Steroidobacteraceae bacterium]|nr:hypothetical protein [Steroidobacteraceae bacterium]